MLGCLMLSQSFLKQSSCLKFFLSIQLQWFLLLCLPVCWSISVSSNLPLIPLVYFFLISVIVFFSSVYFFLMFSNFLLKTSNFLLWSSELILSSLSIFVFITFNSLLGRLLVSISFSSFFVFYLVSSFGTYFSVISFWLIFCFYSYIFCKLVMFPSLGEVALCRECPVGLSSALPSGQ